MLYLHIGWRKCGSSTIQTFLAENSDLLERHGLHYPTAGRMAREDHTSPSHEHLARSLMVHSNATPEAEIAELRGLADAPRDSIISSEMFIQFNPEKIAELRDLLGSNVRILVYLRPFAEIMESEYAQYTKAGKNADDIDRFVSAMLKSNNPYRNLDIARVVRDWAGVFGGERVRVRSLAAIAGTLVDDLAEVIGMPPVGRVKRINESPNWATVEFIRFVNLHIWKTRLASDMTHSEQRALRQRSKRLLARCMAVEQRLGTGGQRIVRLRPDHHDKLRRTEMKRIAQIREIVEDVRVIEPPEPRDRKMLPGIEAVPAEWLKEYFVTLAKL